MRTSIAKAPAPEPIPPGPGVFPGPDHITSALEDGTLEKMIECRVVPNREAILVGNDGSVWRRVNPFTRPEQGYSLASIRQGQGRTSPTLTTYIHKLVLETFVGPRPEGMECRHLDGNPANNQLDNLAWGTPVENAADRTRHGTQPHGSRNSASKLVEADILEIRRLASEGLAHAKIGKRFGLGQGAISAIVRRDSWKHVPAAL